MTKLLDARHQELQRLKQRLTEAKTALGALPKVEWTEACSVGSSNERVAWLRFTQAQDLVNAISRRIVDIEHPPSSNFMKDTRLLGWDHPDFSYILSSLRGEGVNPDTEKELALKLREVCTRDYQSNPDELNDLISKYVGCGPL